MEDTINKSEMLQAIRQRNRDYMDYATPRFDAEEYSRIIDNAPVDQAPDNYDFFSHNYYAYNDWQKNRNSIIRDEALGRYAKADADEQTLKGLATYLQTNDPQYYQFYDDVINGRMNDSDLNNNIGTLLVNGNNDLALQEINRQINTNIVDIKNSALKDADSAQDEVDYYDSKLTNNWYNRKSRETDINFTDIDTYLYRMPGIMGSSSGTILADTATAIGSFLAWRIPYVGPILGPAVAIAGNLYSRDKESNAEAYSGYKQGILNDLSEDGKDIIMKDAKAFMAKQGYSQDRIDNDEYVEDLILTNRIPISNIELDKLKLKHSRGIKSLYLDNMALAASDVGLTALEVAPMGFGKISRVFKSAAALSKVEKAASKVKDAVTLGRLRLNLSNRIDDVLKFGLTKSSQLATYNLRKKMVDAGGRILVTMGLEGLEEGIQYIRSDQYTKGNYDLDANIVDRWLGNTATGARAAYAALTPWDPIYSNDKEFIENVKSGMILGGLMGGTVTTLSSTADASRLYKMDKLVSGLYSDYLDSKDRMHKNVLYAQTANRNNTELINRSFDSLSEMNLEDITDQDIQNERDKFNKIYNMTTSTEVRDKAKQLGIDPRTNFFEVYVAMRDYYSDLYDTTKSNYDKATADYESLINSNQIDDYIRTNIIPKIKGSDKADADTISKYVSNIKKLLISKYQLEVATELKDSFKEQTEKSTQIKKDLGILTSNADFIDFNKMLNFNEEAMKKNAEVLDDVRESLKAIGLKDEDFALPTLHNDLKQAYEKQVLTEIDFKRAEGEKQIVEGDDADLIKTKITKYLLQDKLSDKFAQAIEDYSTGKQAEREQEQVEQVIEPAPYEDEVSTEKENLAAPTTEQQLETHAKSEPEPQQPVQQSELEPVEQPTTVEHTNEDTSSTRQPAVEQSSQQPSIELTPTDYTELSETRDKVNKSRDKFTTSTEKGSRLKPGGKYGALYDKATGVMNSLYSDTTNDIKEYQLENDIDLLDSEDADTWFNIKSLRDRMEEAVYNGDIKEANEIYNELNQLLNSNPTNKGPKLKDLIEQYHNTKKESEKSKEAAANAIEEGREEEQVTELNRENQQRDKENQKELNGVIPVADNDGIPTQPAASDTSEPTQVEDIPTLDDLLGDLVPDQQPAIQTPEQSQTEQKTEQNQSAEPIAFNDKDDHYSHELNYRLTKNGQLLSYQGMEDYLNNSEFSELSTNPDFLNAAATEGYFVVRDYKNDQGNIENAIYFIVPYDGKNYIAAVYSLNGLQTVFNRMTRKPLPFDTQQRILNNLQIFREKILNLWEQVKKNPDLVIVPVNLNATTGTIINEKNEDGSPKNRKLTDSAFMPIKDPYKITPQNTTVGISTGNRSNAVVRYNDTIISMLGRQLGQPMWKITVPRFDGGTDVKLIKLNYATFKGNDQIAELILQLVTSEDNFFIDANGNQVSINPKDLLKFLVNFGTHTIVNNKDNRLTEDLVQALLKKQFYQDQNGNIILGTNIYSLSDLLTNLQVRNQALNYIKENFHYAIDEYGLNRLYLGGSTQSQVKDMRFESVRSYLKNSNVDKIILIPGQLEFTLKDFGLTKDSNGNKIVDQENPNGISVLGWYIKQGILLTDIADKLHDAKLYAQDVTLVNRSTRNNNKQVDEKIDKANEQPISNDNVQTIASPDGGTVTINLDDIFSTLDGKKNGPNMEEDPSLLINQEGKMDVEEATNWLASVLGITPEITLNVIDVTEAGNAVVGRVTEDSILLYRDAPEGALYHEAWHRVSQLLISDRQRKKLYNKYRKRNNTNLSDKEIDEILAEQFRDFEINEAQYYNFETKNWFRRILDFIKLWARTGSYGLARMYTNVNRGKYNGLTPSAENIARFRSIYGTDGPNMEVLGYQFKNISTVKQLNDITNSLTYAWFRTSFNEGFTLDYQNVAEMKDSFDRLKLILQALNFKIPSPVIEEIIEKFDDIFTPMIQNNLKNLGIRAVDKNEDLTEIEEGTEGINVAQHIVEGYNISIQDNAPAEVKFFFQTIPAYEIAKDGSAVTKRDPNTGFLQFVDSKKSWINVLKDLHGCRNLKNLVSKVFALSKRGDPYYQALLFRLNDLIKKTTSLNQKEAMHAEALLTKIETVVTCDINNFVTVKVQRDENGKTILRLVDNTVDVKALKYPKLWSQNLFTASGLFRYTQDGTIVADVKAKEGLKGIIDTLNKLKTAFTSNKGIIVLGERKVDLHIPANLEAAKDIIIRSLNTVGIGIDKPTLNRVLSSGDFGSQLNDDYNLLSNFVTNTNKFGNLSKIIDVLGQIYKSINNDGSLKSIVINENVTRPTQIWNNIGIIKYLANFYASTHATDSSLSSLGPDGNNYYQVSQNNFAKDRIDELNNDKELVQLLDAVTYNQGSILLEAAKNGQTLGIETFVSFKDDTSYDTGRDYFNITDREDYLAKMTAILKDRIVFPTVADKKTYHFITGVRLPHEAIKFVNQNGNTWITYGDNALDILLGYCRDELNQIELCLRQIDDDPNHIKEIDGRTVHINDDGTINNDWLEPSRRVANFHTPNKVKWKENGVEHTKTIEGNGARFLLLTGIDTIVTEADGTRKREYVNFNDPMKSAKECLKLAKEHFFNMSPETQKALLSSTLNRLVKKEVKTAISLGIIKGDPNNIYTLRNVLMDSNVVESRKSRYTGLDPNNAEGYAVFDLLADYTINSIISVNEIEKIFNGSPAYYKVKYDKYGITDSSVDKIKRLGALTSTGLNNRLDFPDNSLDGVEYTVAELKDHEIRDKQYATLEQLFIRGSIKETIQELEGQEAWNSVKDLSIKEIKEKYPEAVKLATSSAKKEVAGYKSGINVADAAVYISPRMTKNLLRMRGVWSKDISDAFDILTNPETADKWESDPELYAKANKVILNAMKYVAFGNRFDIPGLSVPYFNKMALFPLFKSVATGDIKALYDRMVESGNEVDMVLFNSAVKAGSVSPTKYYRQAEDSEVELKDGQTILTAEMTDNLSDDQEFRVENLNKLVTYKQKYKYLRQQLETNPHTHEEQMVGTQFMKVNLSNLRDNDMYGREGEQISGAEIKRIVTDSLNKLSDLGVKDIKELVFEGDEVSINKLAKMLKDDARESGANDNILSGLRVEGDRLVIPLDALSDNKWIESRFLSMLDKAVVDVHMPGGAFIQRSAFGLEATSQTVVTEDMINDGKPLLMINEDNSMDSVVSINLFKHIIPNYNKMTFKQARQWLIDHDIIGKNAKANAIGYRIPTQSIASISALRFVDVFPEIMGDTIMLPEGFTKLTGSDFD